MSGAIPAADTHHHFCPCSHETSPLSRPPCEDSLSEDESLSSAAASGASAPLLHRSNGVVLQHHGLGLQQRHQRSALAEADGGEERVDKPEKPDKPSSGLLAAVAGSTALLPLPPGKAHKVHSSPSPGKRVKSWLALSLAGSGSAAGGSGSSTTPSRLHSRQSSCHMPGGLPEGPGQGLTPAAPPAMGSVQEVAEERPLQVLGLMLLHPSMQGEVGPSFSHMLAGSRCAPSKAPTAELLLRSALSLCWWCCLSWAGTDCRAVAEERFDIVLVVLSVLGRHRLQSCC